MRKPIIAGNWKMYKTPKESLAFLDAFLPLVEDHTRDEILIFPTMSSLGYVIDGTTGTNVRAGAQNMHWLNEVHTPARPHPPCLSPSAAGTFCWATPSSASTSTKPMSA